MRNPFSHSRDDRCGDHQCHGHRAYTEFYVCYDVEIDSVMFGIRTDHQEPMMLGLSPVRAMHVRDMFSAAIADAVTMPEGMA